MKTICIIGAGPAGLFSALLLGSKANTMLMEKNAKAGLKLRISGSGQANLTHSGNEEDFIKHYGNHGHFLKHALYNFNNQTLCKFFNDNGIPLIERQDGKYFPQNKKADSIADKMVSLCLENKVKIMYQQPVLSISKYGKDFSITTPTNTMTCDIVILTTGGITYPQTGSTGDGYRIAAALGHEIIQPKPALVPFTIKNYPWGHLAGISYDHVKTDIIRNKKCIASLTDAVLFTHTGLSGPAILHISRYAQKRDIVRLHILTEIQSEQLSKTLKGMTSTKKTVKTILHDFGMVFRMIDMIIPMCKISDDDTPSHLSREKREALLNLLQKFDMEIADEGDINAAMVTTGGVNLEEVNSKTMESRIVPNLYFAGEVLDIDGDSGGYNLQAAFSTAYTAVKDILGKNY
jgi:predicted Rossmann fold flavoprotein